MFLIDTNVICELRKGTDANPALRAWFLHHAKQPHYLSVLTVGEIRRGVEQIRTKDPAQALAYERFLSEIMVIFAGRILEIRLEDAEIWGRLSPHERLPD